MDSLKKNIIDNNITDDKEINDILKKINKSSDIVDIVEYNNDLNKLKSKKEVYINSKNNNISYDKQFYSDEELNDLPIDYIRDLNVKINDITRRKEIDNYNATNKDNKKIVTNGGVTFISDIQNDESSLGASAVIMGGSILSQLSIYNIILVVFILLLLLCIHYLFTCNSIDYYSNLNCDTMNNKL